MNKNIINRKFYNESTGELNLEVLQNFLESSNFLTNGEQIEFVKDVNHDLTTTLTHTDRWYYSPDKHFLFVFEAFVNVIPKSFVTGGADDNTGEFYSFFSTPFSDVSFFKTDVIHHHAHINKSATATETGALHYYNYPSVRYSNFLATDIISVFPVSSSFRGVLLKIV